MASRPKMVPSRPSFKSKSSVSSSTSNNGTEMTFEEQGQFPSKEQLDQVGELPVLDKAGKAHTFRSLWDRKEPTERRNVVVFIRHFFCGSCQEYVRTLSSSLSPAGLYLRNPPTTLTVIGCGDPSLISEYMIKTASKFDVYADPGCAIYLSLGMTSNSFLGDKKPNYIKKSFIDSVMSDAWSIVSKPTAFPGNKSQNGGEWIWIDGDLRWCRRMRNTRDHTEVEDLKKILAGQKEIGDRDGKYAEVYRDSVAIPDERIRE